MRPSSEGNDETERVAPICCGEPMVYVGQADLGPVRLVLTRCFECESHRWTEHWLTEVWQAPAVEAWIVSMDSRLPAVRREIAAKAYGA